LSPKAISKEVRQLTQELKSSTLDSTKDEEDKQIKNKLKLIIKKSK
jgi:hypothetical protein